MTILHLDDETRSAADLKKVGLSNYAADPTTGLWCSAFAFDDDPVQLWTAEGNTDDAAVRAAKDHIRKGGLVYAHNAAFELKIGRHVAPRYGWPELQLEQMRCTMAMAYVMALPGSLEHCAAALGIDQQKDMKGSRVMMQLARPRSIAPDGSPVWWDDRAKLDTLYAYCMQDVEVERACHKRMLELTPEELELWRFYQRMNERGIPVDLASIDRAIALVESEKARLDQAMRDITSNVVAGCTDVRQLVAWLRYRGVMIPGVAKADVLDVLQKDAEGHQCGDCRGSGKLTVIEHHHTRGVSSSENTCGECGGAGRIYMRIPDDCRQALRLRQEAAKTSTAKLTAMRDAASPDGRVRDCTQHYGAHTGRSAGRRIQPLNFPRPSILHTEEDVEDAIANLHRPQYLEMMYGSPMTVLADCLRGMIRAPEGREFICCDFSNIEGRVLAWLAGEEWKLKAFRDYDNGTGPDLYLLSYSRAFGCTIDEAKPNRQVGKVMELALGYEGGVGAFQTMARGYGVKVSDERANELKELWRAAHPKTAALWKGLQAAAIRAIKTGETHEYRGLKFRVKGSFLFCRLHSGRVLTYPYPRLGKDKWGRDNWSYMRVNSVTRKWERHETYGGDQANHVTQATARDIQTSAMLRLEAAGYPLDLEIYDEDLAEVPMSDEIVKTDGISCAKSVDEMSSLMSNAPHWATGLPVAATGWAGSRYRKD